MSSVFTEFSDSSAAPFRGWVFYDGECAFCTRWARSFEPSLLECGFHCAALQEPWVATLLHLERRELLRAVLVWTPDGAQREGTEAIVFVARHIRWARPLLVVARIPGVMPVLRRLYARMAVRRRCVHAGAPHVSAPGGI